MKGTILNDWQKAVDDAAAVGIKYMVCAWLSPVERGRLSITKNWGRLNTAGEICKKAGIQLCTITTILNLYRKTVIPYEALLDYRQGPGKMEMDLYWVTKANPGPIS